MTEPYIDREFSLLDEWRHLPDYQLERRADIYFALFLPIVLENHLKKSFHPEVIPEFPLRHGSIGSKLRTEEDRKGVWPNQSAKVDYLALTEDGCEVFLVELKTDMNSVEQTQICNLNKAKRVEFRKLVEGVLCIAKVKNMASKYRRKYIHLLARLSELGQLCIPGKVYERLSQKTLEGIRGELREVRNNVTPEGMKPKVVYVLPCRSPKIKDVADHVITFAEFADVVECHGDIGKRFAKSLRCWAKHPAGSVPLGTPCP